MCPDTALHLVGLVSHIHSIGARLVHTKGHITWKSEAVDGVRWNWLLVERKSGTVPAQTQKIKVLIHFIFALRCIPAAPANSTRQPSLLGQPISRLVACTAQCPSLASSCIARYKLSQYSYTQPDWVQTCRLVKANGGQLSSHHYCTTNLQCVGFNIPLVQTS